MSYTAVIAGCEEVGERWAAACMAEIGVRVLIQHRDRLRSRGLITLSDQQAAAKRTWQELLTKEEVSDQAWSKCWRDRSAEIVQSKLTDETLKRNLSSLQMKVNKWKSEAFSVLSLQRYRDIEDHIRITTQSARVKDKIQSLRRVKNLEKRNRDCSKHLVCRWVRNHWRKNREARGESDRDRERNGDRQGGQNRTESETVSSETVTGKIRRDGETVKGGAETVEQESETVNSETVTGEVGRGSETVKKGGAETVKQESETVNSETVTGEIGRDGETVKGEAETIEQDNKTTRGGTRIETVNSGTVANTVDSETARQQDGETLREEIVNSETARKETELDSVTAETINDKTVRGERKRDGETSIEGVKQDRKRYGGQELMETAKRLQQEREQIMTEFETVNERIKPMKTSELQTKMITVYGGVKLTGRERQYLMLGPDFTTPEKMERKQFKKDFQTTLTKVRWGRMDLEPDEIVRMKTIKQEEEEEEREKRDFLEKRLFVPERKEVRLRMQRCTQMKTSRRVVFPPGRGAKEEAVLETRKAMWQGVADRFMRENCKEDGSMDETQLTTDQVLGRASIRKRVMKKEIHVSCSDKGKGIVVMPLELYETVTKRHTEGDEEIDWRKLKEIQKHVTAHARSLARVFNLGKGEGDRNRIRCHENITTWAQHPPVLRSMAKTHKAPNQDGSPKTRPVVGASSGMGTGLGEILSDLVRPVYMARKKQFECQSTEEMVHQIEEANQRMEREGVKDVMVGSLDVVSLYPSIDQEMGARIVAEELINNGVRYQGVDIQKAARYLAASLSKERIKLEGVGHLLPGRRAQGKQGRNLTVRTRELGGPISREERREATQRGRDTGEREGEGESNETTKTGRRVELDRQEEEIARSMDEMVCERQEESKWIDVGRKYTEGEEVKIISMVIQIGIEECMGNHVYSFKGRIYRQTKGGAIGVRLTGEVSRVVMDRWSDLMTRSMEVSRVECYMLSKYVDDIDLATSTIPKGHSWIETDGDRRLEFSQERWERDRDRQTEETDWERTMALLVEEGDRLVPGIRLTSDLPEKHKNGKCPVLDIAVWKDNSGEGGAAKVRYTFFEKEVSAPTVFHAKAAYSWRSKIVTLSEELRRRFRNTDRLHSRQEITDIVERFLIKLATSGYDRGTRTEILRSATVKYYREILDSETGGRPLYRSSKEMQRDRTFKGLETKTWFRPRRGGKKVRERRDLPWRMDRWRGRKVKVRKGGEQSTVVEAVCFVPFTPGSRLKTDLQTADDILSQTMDAPRVRFVERGGQSVIEEVGSNNPWKQEQFCDRDSCGVCEGRMIIGAEKEEETAAMVTGESKPSKRPKEDMIALPGCTEEGVNYSLECLRCRKGDIRRQYLGETSRSGFQRYQEHMREIQSGHLKHPLVIHFLEEHGGEVQRVLFSDTLPRGTRRRSTTSLI